MPGLRSIGGKLKKFLTGKPATVQVDVLTGYAHWADHYPPAAHNPFMEIEEAAMLSLLPDLAGKACLDLGCGTGRYIHLLQARQARQITGIDYSAHMLAQANIADARFKLVHGLFLALPFASATFDLITCGLAVGHEKNLRGVLAEAARVLRRGGSIIYSDFHPFATLAGWQRSFINNGTVFKLEHHLHLYHDHQQACRQAGLTIEAVLEPSASQHVPAQFRPMPVVLVIRAVKTGH